MKTLVYLFTIAFLIFAGCAKDEIFDNNMSSPALKDAKVPIPVKADLYAAPDMGSALIQIPGTEGNIPDDFITSGMIIGGTVTHLGRLVSGVEESYYEINPETFEILGVENNLPVFFQSGTGVLVGANGDRLEYDWNATGTGIPLSYTGEVEFKGGTGKFEGCSGNGLMAGSFDDANINHYTVEGTLEFN